MQNFLPTLKHYQASVIFIALAFIASSSHACECPSLDLNLLEENSSAVMTGQLIAAQYLADENKAMANFHIFQSIKGRPPENSNLFVESYSQNNSCGLPLIMEKMYLVFVNDSTFVTNCNAFLIDDTSGKAHQQEIKQYLKARQP